jgi:hypothetical protein
MVGTRSSVVGALSALLTVGVAGVPAVAAEQTAVAPAALGAQAADCFWAGPTGTLGDGPQNYAFPDSGARYFFATFTMPAGARVVLDGTFAHARYQSLNSYNATTFAPTDALNDVATEPDAGSTNPFLPGAQRARNAHRSYTAYVVDQVPPAPGASRAANTLYAGVKDQPKVTLVYRLYVPDKNRDDTGGVGLPRPHVKLADGSTVTGSAVCDTLAVEDRDQLPISALPAATYNALRSPATNPLAATQGFPAFADPQWQAYYNTPFSIGCTYLHKCTGTPARIGGQYSNIDNNYVTTYANEALGEVLVLRGKLPTTPSTYQRRPVMARDVDMRYWSICTNESYVTTRATGCLYDEEMLTDSDGWYTIVLSLPADRPANADRAHGVNWLSLSPNGDGLCTVDPTKPCYPDTNIIIRNMLPNPAFPHAVQNTKTPGDERAVMGDYLPTGQYMSTAQYEALNTQ